MIEVLKQALEALKDVGVLTDREWQAVHKNKANELRQAIAELESQEPVAWYVKNNGEPLLGSEPSFYLEEAEEILAGQIEDSGSEIAPLYPHPQRTWVGLTEQEQFECMEARYEHGMSENDIPQIIEAKLKDKNCL
jgi:hypothetical protein